ncbi:hypothetical protein [Kitasatospora cheerisanensis]|uniref:Uncharacterized protein n=1 Tax=Kitasatospora cheerisanensis KCTC 2395 TaxID=1348663 RepID=A0A066YH05_9ACTN|nr:hypothetical protein [Kitasatospora cheerisanensis]KDN80763.1 hypothetical protein KCH_75430 [Kitasatospora cheerisanensis KCTC 2395]
MELFACAHCASALTRPVGQVRFPPYAYHQVGNGRQMSDLMDVGTYAVDPDPSGPPYRSWEDLAEGEAEARGYYAPVPHYLSDGPPGRPVLAPADVTGTVLIPGSAGGFCCGITGQDGPNLACAHCGHPVGAREDDCSLWQAVRLEPDAVRRVPAGPRPPVADWTVLVHERSGVPPVRANGQWNDRSCQEIGTTLVDLIVAADGSPVRFDHAGTATVFERALHHYQPGADGPAKRCALHGPGRP